MFGVFTWSFQSRHETHVARKRWSLRQFVAVRPELCPLRTGAAVPNWLCLPGLLAPVISQHHKLQCVTRGLRGHKVGHAPEDMKLQ